MNNIGILGLKCFRHVYQGIFGKPAYQSVPLCSIEEGGELIFSMLSKDEPCMIARYGANELSCISNYLEINYGEHNVWKNIKGESHDWWWNRGMAKNMFNVAGFFPTTDDNLSRFSQLMLEDSKIVDAIAVFNPVKRWLPKITSYIPKNVEYFPRVSFDSFILDNPWTRVLEGQKILVIHPFAELIESQYAKRELLFDNPAVLPDFELITLKSVQSIGGVTEQGFSNWFEGLDWMIKEIDKITYEIVLIGCGAYGFPLAAHAKRTGHKAVHIGGTLQLLFGIKGKRWEDSKYGTVYGLPEGSYSQLMDNPSWVRPEEYRTKQSENAEGACYW